MVLHSERKSSLAFRKEGIPTEAKGFPSERNQRLKGDAGGIEKKPKGRKGQGQLEVLHQEINCMERLDTLG